jgi:hypothetical protein
MAIDESDIKSKLYTWYICTECSEEKTMKSPCVVMLTGRSSNNALTKEEIQNYRDYIKKYLECVVPKSPIVKRKSPHWKEIAFKDLISQLSADPRVIQESKISPPQLDLETEDQKPKSKNRFSELELV